MSSSDTSSSTIMFKFPDTNLDAFLSRFGRAGCKNEWVEVLATCSDAIDFTGSSGRCVMSTLKKYNKKL